MAEHVELGRKGEEIAFYHLIKKGYKVIERNWRFDHTEVDIIATHNNRLIIVEVKTRTAAVYEEPREALSSRKIKHLTHAAEAYIMEHEIDMETRFDAVFIKWYSETKYELMHIEDAFSPLIE
jgi:putative endonuclease